MTYTCGFLSSISQIPSDTWAKLSKNAGPFVQYEFLNGLEQTGCVGPDTGWTPAHLVIYQHETLVAVMPGYLKEDSYGEYVFDQGWAQAYQQHGLPYYPKWVSAIPFTPVTTSQLLCAPDHDRDALVGEAVKTIHEHYQTGCSSAHILFVPPHESDEFLSHDFLARFSVQFQWYNYDYQHLDDFTAALTSRKRKSLRKSKEKLSAAGITFHPLTREAIRPEHMHFFIRCYQLTYMKRSGHTGYLTPAFFMHLYHTLSQSMLLIEARRANVPIASALLFYDESGLYGRYWGTTELIDGLHFECCYNQGIAFAIENKLPLFNPGTQGEHKILRGFEPTYCMSLHHLDNKGFHNGVREFLAEEKRQITHYFEQAATVLPFNQAMKERLITKTNAQVIFHCAQHKNE
ncbi:GNAT family N-acetyltransferase [Alteromonas sp. C1M14]|uniref:GNAT family N-acetyltransferase n=1 Tax=Alteromonas sp. C1M14 TaxID=2841567 RepID=UPI001C09838D|nr:GNAT family N-acetyltransferase [Alteromonas sp. C1M14]MBU2978001.1 GNAT family N-acetyltransferase [Alteromonas sp. C1M14]